MELFVDLNCPFCFWQVERVVRLELTEGVTWRGFEHTPSLPVPPDRQHPAARSIETEISMLKDREPACPVADPGFRPNTRYATAALFALGRIHPEAQWPAVRALGRALWTEGSDISDVSEVHAVLAEFGGGDIVITQADERQVDANADAWATGPFERRLPSARSAHGAVLLGLNDEERFRLFVRSGLFSVHGGESC